MLNEWQGGDQEAVLPFIQIKLQEAHATFSFTIMQQGAITVQVSKNRRSSERWYYEYSDLLYARTVCFLQN
ncbi:hypothetical protein [Sporomusa sp. KB1]|uniref:hypothetical protein n=1 Tax=Sporomusa sp. KB1 TaxID=943346 RepID=UPI001C977CA9|nr:hypothetical protein [Sporomusa sp. KB1]